MPTVKVRNLKNEEVGDLELSEAVFGAELNEALIHAAVKSHLAGARQGTVGTKTRGDVSGSGKKLWKQKGTGRARATGHSRSPKRCAAARCARLSPSVCARVTSSSSRSWSSRSRRRRS